MRLSFENIVAIVLKKTGKAISSVEAVILHNKQLALLTDNNEKHTVYYGSVSVVATDNFRPSFKFNNGSEEECFGIVDFGGDLYHQRMENVIFTYIAASDEINDGDECTFAGYKFTLVDLPTPSPEI